MSTCRGLRRHVDGSFFDASSAITPFLTGHTFNVYTLPSISLNFTGQPGMVLQLQGVQINQIAGPAGVNLLAIQATPGIVPESSALQP